MLYVNTSTSVCAPCACNAWEGQQRALDPLELELVAAVRRPKRLLKEEQVL